MRFTVISPTRALPKVNQATWFLVQDSWDDYGFKTLYHLHFVTPDSSTNVGAVKILRQGQIDFDHTRIDEDFDALDHRYASVGQSLDYYEHLAAMGAVTRDTILTALNDIVKNPEDRSRFESEKGWRKSLFRDQESATISEFLALAGSLISGDYTSLPAEELKFSFQLTDWEKPVDFDFTKGVDSFEFLTISSNPLPDRVIALIGRNGSGKSTVLARLSRVAFGTAEQRSAGAFDNLGSIEPKGIGFPRIIAVSYSAFDSFALPGIAPRSVDSTDEREQIVQDVRRGEGRYIFCGLRDIASELKAKIQQSASIEEPLDRVHKTLLKSITELATEFGNTLSLIERRNRVDDLRAAFNIIATDPSVAFLGEEYILQKLVPEKAEAAFVEWSTGQKIVAQIVASLVAHMTPRSLLLLDEPEMHLHPPLVATLMHAIRSLLCKYKGFAIIATHSPVVLQETLAKHVYIVRREEAATKVSKPAVQTFGENVGYLTSEVFGVNSQVTDFHRTLDMLIKKNKSIESIEDLFKPDGLSLMARAYVMSQLAAQGNS